MENMTMTFDTDITCEEPYDEWADLIKDEELIPFGE